MKYSSFERLVLGLSAIAIISMVAVSLRGEPIPEEIAAQLMILGVLVGAVHWGRTGGFIAALIATAVYIVMRVPLIATEGLIPAIGSMIAVRMVTYGIIGIVGGEVCGRIKYVLARIEGNETVDDVSGVYNGKFMAQMLASRLGEDARYGTGFSVILLTLASCLTAELRPSRQNHLIRSAANHVRNDIRLVDDVGRLDDGRFVLILPHTPKEGALVAAERVRKGVCHLVGARDESVTVDVMSTPGDRHALQALLESIAPRVQDQPSSETASDAAH